MNLKNRNMRNNTTLMLSILTSSATEAQHLRQERYDNNVLKSEGMIGGRGSNRYSLNIRPEKDRSLV